MPAAGRLFVMPRPPSHEIELIVDSLRQRDVGKIVCLLPSSEIDELGLVNERDLCAVKGIDFVHFPIVDFGLPEGRTFARLAATLAEDLRQGLSIAIHCRAGIGRTGLLSGCVLKELGYGAADAIAMISKARGVAIPDTAEQRQFIEDYAPSNPARQG